jgi:hypothetical protein
VAMLVRSAVGRDGVRHWTGGHPGTVEVLVSRAVAAAAPASLRARHARPGGPTAAESEAAAEEPRVRLTWREHVLRVVLLALLGVLAMPVGAWVALNLLVTFVVPLL